VKFQVEIKNINRRSHVDESETLVKLAGEINRHVKEVIPTRKPHINYGKQVALGEITRNILNH
jgi:hypothetical protein